MNQHRSYVFPAVGFDPLRLYGLELGGSFESQVAALAAMHAQGFSAAPEALDEDYFFVMEQGDESEVGGVSLLLKYTDVGVLSMIGLVLCGRAIKTSSDALSAATDMRKQIEQALPVPTCELDQIELWSDGSYQHPSDVAFSAFWSAGSPRLTAATPAEYGSHMAAATGQVLSASISTAADDNGMAISLCLQLTD